MKQKIRTILLSILSVATFAVWVYVFYRIDGDVTANGIIAALFMLIPTFGILFYIGVIIKRLNIREPLWTWEEPKPRKLPLWYRVLSKIFR